MLLTISGLSGSGKSTAAKLLSERLRIKTIDVGTIFRAMAKRRRMDVIAFGEYVAQHPEIDRKLDEAMMTRARKGSLLILQGRLAGLMAQRHRIPSIRIWIDASTKVRAERVAKRETTPFTQALHEVQKRDSDNRARYKMIYGLDLNDMSVYDIVVQTDNLSPEQVISVLLEKLSVVWPKKHKIPLQQAKILLQSSRQPTQQPRPKNRPRRQRP